MDPALPPLAFNILAIQFLFVALGVGVLIAQRASAKMTVGLPTWKISTGKFAVFSLKIMASFFGGTILILALFTQFGFDLIGDKFWVLVASLIVQLGTAEILIRFSSGYAFNFSKIKENRLFQWKTGYVFLGCVALVTFASWSVFGVKEMLNYFCGLNLTWPKQELVEILLQNRDNAPLMVMAFLTAVVGAPIWEELFFRGCVYRFFKGKQNRHLAAAVTGVLFALIHFNVEAFIPLAALGAYLCYVYERTGDIRVPIVVHALFNLNSFLVMVLAPEIHEMF